MIEDETSFYEQNQRRKLEEQDWVRKRREDYDERQKRISEHPPDEDAWNK